jgi:hypothetical protein
LQLKGFEFIKAVHLDPVPLDMERDLITPTYKKKRPQLLKYYQVKSEKTIHFSYISYILVNVVTSLALGLYVYKEVYFLLVLHVCE